VPRHDGATASAVKNTQGNFMIRTLFAPAKINLCLHVLGKRPDGYHDLAMLMQQVDLYDRIELKLNSGGQVQVRCDGVTLADGEENIAARAARALLDLDDSRRGVEIVIDKQIPVAAGLGGGSSDAAAVLAGLNDLLELKLSGERLRAIGVTLGADVPFFLYGPAAWATGIGDRLEPVPPLPPVRYVLVNPGVAVSTAWVYQNLGLTSRGEVAKLPGFPGTVPALVAYLHNDLEAVTAARYPVVHEVKAALLAHGAIGALMSGSGPTVFGVFSDQSAAEQAAARIAAAHPWRVVTTCPL
jgi:4-diphosphocytidyl-2-C-methyl-D-erythritol kinase